jgi:hypothetical protein
MWATTSDVYILRRYREAEDDVGPYLEAILGVEYRFQFVGQSYT